MAAMCPAATNSKYRIQMLPGGSRLLSESSIIHCCEAAEDVISLAMPCPFSHPLLKLKAAVYVHIVKENLPEVCKLSAVLFYMCLLSLHR